MTEQEKEKFWAKADQSGDCWIWRGPQKGKGYGGYRHKYAHRVAYEIAKGPIPPGMEVCHSCDNPPCVNPNHLWLGTRKDNLHDMRKKGRGYRVGQHGASSHAHRQAVESAKTKLASLALYKSPFNVRGKLTYEQVTEIRKRYITEDITAPQLAQEFGVSVGVIEGVVQGRTYRQRL